ncbi:MAG: D-2-hydroxyacid dehydrogenase [Clostridia bacterium]|nr:D-2-hydroxyacid dehydrogenase [Clostridia bacterium]
MKILVTGAWQCTEEQLNIIRNMGHEVVFMQNEKDRCPVDYAWIEGVICNGLFLYHDIRKFTSLKYIQLTSAGFDRVDVDYINANNITIYNARGVYSVPMAEYALCGVLQLLKNTRFFDENQKKREWVKNRSVLELCGKNVCIVGCGNVGTECAKRFKAFGCNVFGVDLYPRQDESYSVIYSLQDLTSALSKVQVVVLTLPLTEESRHIINAEALASLPDDAILVNIARGGVVDTAALIDVLSAGKLGGAVLDVFEEEPLSEGSPLWGMDNVIVTPHNSFVGDGNSQRLADVIMTNLRGN